MRLNLLTTTTIAMLLASSAYAQETIKIGVLTPLSGTYAGIGQQVRWGIDQSVEEINAAAGSPVVRSNLSMRTVRQIPQLPSPRQRSCSRSTTLTS